MPSFYSAGLPTSHVPVLTPEHASKYGYNAYGGIPDQNAYAAYGVVGCHDLSALSSEPYDPYKAVAPPSATIFPSNNNYGSVPTKATSAASSVRPSRVDQRHSSQGEDARRRRHGHSAVESQPKEEQVVGGVSAKLDYQMDMMTDFVSEMAAGMYDLYISRICVADIDLLGSIKTGLKPNVNFRKWVLHVLNATRLPSATILTSLHYLSLRVRDLSAKGQYTPSEHGLYQLLTVALILGSKFLDDNTFQNKSWAEVSGIKVSDLNRDEREWLAAFGHRLHYHPQSPEGFNYWQDRWDSFQIRAVSIASVLYPIDTDVQRQRSLRQSSIRQTPSPVTYPTQFAKMPTQRFENPYPTPTQTPYHAWFPQRSAVEKSPSTAPHTGPTTPEYYGTQNIWSQDGYSQQSHFGYATLPSIPQQTAPYHPAYNTPYPSHYGWSGHGSNCDCMYCPRQTVPHYMMPPRYGPTVAG